MKMSTSKQTKCMVSLRYGIHKRPNLETKAHPLRSWILLTLPSPPFLIKNNSVLVPWSPDHTGSIMQSQLVCVQVLALLCTSFWLTSEAKRVEPMRNYRIDLQQPPETRWREVLSDYNSSVPMILDYFESMVNTTYSSWSPVPLFTLAYRLPKKCLQWLKWSWEMLTATSASWARRWEVWLSIGRSILALW